MRVNTRSEALVVALLPQKGILVQAALVLAASTFTALAAQARINLPFTPVPITGQTLAVLLVGALLGSRLAAASMIAYWSQGAAGLPVFAGGMGGWHVVTGPTGGYLVGFIAAAYVVGFLAERGWDRRLWTLAPAMLVGEVLIYIGGLSWLAHFTAGKSVFELGLYPFIPGDAIKLLLAASLVPSGRAALAALPVTGLPMRATGWTLTLPWQRIYCLGAALLVIGSLLPWGTDAGRNASVNGLAAGEGVVVLVAAAAALVGVALAWRGLLAPFVSHLWQSTVAVGAGFVAFFNIIHAVADETFWLASIGPGLVLVAAGAVVIFVAALGEGAPEASLAGGEER
ncbi:MAG: biotin transporter BioY [Dehalococcoidia bacterium]